MLSLLDDGYTQTVSKILVVDDDATVRGVVVDYLKAGGHEVEQAENGPDALLIANKKRDFDLIILDLMLPGLDGLEVFRRLKSSQPELQIIMLTAKVAEADRILGLELGADDYLTKPFSPRELVLRVKAVLRRLVATSNHSAHDVVRDGDLVIDLDSRKATLANRELNLTLREFDLLVHLMTNPNIVMSRTELMGAVWGWDYGDSTTVTVHVRRLRGKIERDPSQPTRLVTVWGRGYRWEPTS
ncbi:DNA-binding response regulator [Leucobacter sp. OH2974_COT-288]|nr:DNA-binding response regulator [Leucobacter sp. OH2974_COT-288]